ncbi:MAG: hypothetical protein RL375_502 [Pseudomonadota bacterium]
MSFRSGRTAHTTTMTSWLLTLLVATCLVLVGCETTPPAPPPPPPKPPLPSLLAAVEAGDVEQVKRLVAAGEDIGQRVGVQTALQIASTRCDQTMVKTLISLGATIRPNIDYALPLDAIACDNLPLVAMLADLKGAYLERNVTWEGYKVTPLGMAVAKRQHDLARLLIDKGAKLNGHCALGRCEGDWELAPLHVAARTANVEMVRLLVNRGADTVVLDKNLLAPVIHLVMNKAGSEAQTVEIIKLIVAKGGIESMRYKSPRGPALGFIPDQWKEVRQVLTSLGASQADVDRYKKEEDARWKKVEEENAARIAREKAAREAAEAGEGNMQVTSDNSGNCSCTRRTQRWVAQRSSSGQVRGNMGHYEFYDEKVPCACR